MKCQEVYFAIVLLLLLAMLVGCKQNGSSPSVELEDGSRVSFTALDSLADFNPDSADNLLSRSPLLRESGAGDGCDKTLLLLRIKTDDKLYRPVTHYRDTILQLIDYFEHNRRVLPSLLGSTGPALPYLYAGRIFADLGDAPQALEYYQQALDVQPVIPSPIGKDREELSLAKQRGLIHSFIGTQFYYQNLYQNALESFFKANSLAVVAKDTVDMIYNLRDVAEQYKFLNKPDSSLFYYQQALALANDNPYFYKNVLSQIASLYITIGDYEQAKSCIQPSIEKIDSTFLTATYSIASKIYKHEGKTDSAEYCYEQLLKCGNVDGKYYAHREMAELCLLRSNVHDAYNHVRSYLAYGDTIKSQYNADVVARMHAAYNYQKHKQKTMELELVNVHQKIAMVLIILSSFLILGFLYTIFRRRQQRLTKKMFRLKVLTEDIRRRSSEYQEMTISRISELNEKIQELKRNTQAANLRHQEEMLQLVAEKDQLEFQLKKQKSDEEVKATGMKAIKQSAVYQQFVKLDNQKNDTPSFSDWAELQRCVNLYFPEFEEYLKGLCKMTNQQYRACMLRWLGFGPSSTAFLTCYSKSSVSNLYMRLYENTMGKRGTMKEFDELLKGL